MKARCVLLALLLLAACAPAGPERWLDNYLARLSRALGESVETTDTVALPRLPRSGALQLDVPPGKLAALDFLTLSGCELQVTIGKMNSSLGKLARPSQRLLLELEYLRLAPACIALQQANDEPALAEVLRTEWRRKQTLLPRRIYNATLASAEFRDFWRAPAALADYPAQVNSAVVQALSTLASHSQRWLTGDFAVDGVAFELLLSDISRGDGGALLLALAQQQATLTTADALLTQRLNRGPLCTPQRRPEAADIINTVVRKFFIGEVQPWSAALDSRRYALLPPLRELEALLEDSLPEHYRAWQQNRDALLTAAANAPRRHVKSVQALLQPCGVLPGA